MPSSHSTTLAVALALASLAEAQDAVITPPTPEQGARFGHALRTQDEWRVLVAEPFDLGRGTVAEFQRTPSGWLWSQTLQPADLAPNWQFGTALDLDGDVLVVGAPGASQAGALAGAGYVFERTTGWNEAQALVPPDLTFGDRLGSAVAVSGDTLVVCAPWHDQGGTDRGKAYVYERGAAGWALTAELQGDDPVNAVEHFGRCCALDGDVLVIGAETQGAASAGEAFVFERSGGTWNQTAILVPTQYMALVASSGLAVDGDTIAVDALGGPGRVLIFERSGSGWAQTQILQGSANWAGDLFGWSLDLAGDQLLVGAPGGKTQNGFPGRAFQFERDASGFHEVKKLLGSVDGDHFGEAVALADSHALIGAPFSTASQPNVEAGAVEVFDRPLGASYCLAEGNSTGVTGQAGATGSLFAMAGDLVLSAKKLPPNEFGLFLVSASEDFVAHPGGSAGNLCLGGEIGRFLDSLSSTGGDGKLAYRVDTSHLPFSQSVPIWPGDTWYFQAWHRDHVPAATSNFTAGLRVTFE